MQRLTVADLLKDDIHWHCDECMFCAAKLPEIRNADSQEEIVIAVTKNVNNELLFMGYHQRCWFACQLDVEKTKTLRETCEN